MPSLSILFNKEEIIIGNNYTGVRKHDRGFVPQSLVLARKLQLWIAQYMAPLCTCIYPKSPFFYLLRLWAVYAQRAVTSYTPYYNFPALVPQDPF